MEIRASFAAVCALVCAFAPAGRALAAEIEGVRVWRAPERTRIVFDLDIEAAYQLIRLDELGQLLIDFEDSRLAESMAPLAELRFEGGPVTALRRAESPPERLRLAVELAEPVEPRGFALPPVAPYGHRLVLDLYDSTPPPVPADPPPPDDPKPLRDIVVAISAGHGGEDPGAVVGDDWEKDITLAVSRYLHEYLGAQPGFRSVMIRDGDYYVPLRRRPEIARGHRADLLVAIHADAYRSESASGMTIYALSGDRADRENAARVARKENSTDLIAGVDRDLHLAEFEDDVALTLVSVHMGWSMEQSQLAGSHILRAAGEITRLRRDKVQQASLQVLNSPDIPSILIETGYMTNPGELRKLKSPDFQRRLAESLATGIMGYFEERAPEGSLLAWRKAGGIDPTPADEVADLASALENTLPAAAVTHTVKRGDTLSAIAARYSVSLSRLREANDLADDRIATGMELKIPRR